LEAGFGQIDGINHPTFSKLEKAQDRIGSVALTLAVYGVAVI
jgi:hypothetical protein